VGDVWGRREDRGWRRRGRPTGFPPLPDGPVQNLIENDEIPPTRSSRSDHPSKGLPEILISGSRIFPRRGWGDDNITVGCGCSGRDEISDRRGGGVNIDWQPRHIIRYWTMGRPLSLVGAPRVWFVFCILIGEGKRAVTRGSVGGSRRSAPRRFLGGQNRTRFPAGPRDSRRQVRRSVSEQRMLRAVVGVLLRRDFVLGLGRRRTWPQYLSRFGKGSRKGGKNEADSRRELGGCRTAWREGGAGSLDVFHIKRRARPGCQRRTLISPSLFWFPEPLRHIQPR